jgi:hypothetical protein
VNQYIEYSSDAVSQWAGSGLLERLVVVFLDSSKRALERHTLWLTASSSANEISAKEVGARLLAAQMAISEVIRKMDLAALPANATWRLVAYCRDDQGAITAPTSTTTTTTTTTTTAATTSGGAGRVLGKEGWILADAGEVEIPEEKVMKMDQGPRVDLGFVTLRFSVTTREKD